MPKAVVLLSGGLDSQLAVRILQEQGIEVEALNFRTVFTCCQDLSARAAYELGVPLTVVSQSDDYLDLIRRPKFGYGRGANPCVDCRIYMFRRAKIFMEQIGADLVASGEVVGQRPMSQKKRDLAIIARHSGLEDRLLRPLSAKLLWPTLPEINGLVDRNRLYGISGRGRKELIELAHGFGLRDIPSPSTGCALTEPQFAVKVHDLVRLDPTSSSWDFELLKIGRHIRFDNQTKVILGRREEENRAIEYLFNRPDSSASAMLEPDNFIGPGALITGPATDESINFAGALMLRYAGHRAPEEPMVRLHTNGTVTLRPASHQTAAEQAVAL